jgi:hypothetical protein
MRWLQHVVFQFLGLAYRCRCGAWVKTSWKAQHEEFHKDLREFFSGPTAEEMAACRASLKSQALIEGSEK